MSFFPSDHMFAVLGLLYYPLAAIRISGGRLRYASPEFQTTVSGKERFFHILATLKALRLFAVLSLLGLGAWPAFLLTALPLAVTGAMHGWFQRHMAFREIMGPDFE